MDTTDWVQILVETVSILNNIHTLGQRHESDHLLALWEIVGQTGLYSVGLPTGIREGKHWIQTFA